MTVDSDFDLSGENKEPGMKAETFLPDDYRPAEDEPFMNERQLEYFRRKLIGWKHELADENKHTIEGLQAVWEMLHAIPVS